MLISRPTLNIQSHRRLAGRQCRRNEYIHDSKSLGAPQVGYGNGSDILDTYSNLEKGMTSMEQKTSQIDYSPEEKICNGKNPQQAMPIDSLDKVSEENNLHTKKAILYTKYGAMENEEEDAESTHYSTPGAVQETFRNRRQQIEIEKQYITDQYNQFVRNLHHNPKLKSITSEDNRMLVAPVTIEGATLKLGSISLTIPEGALKEQTAVFIYNLGFRKTTGSALLCPEIRCGPPGLQFETYVTLSVELFGNLPTEARDTDSLVFCKQEEEEKEISDWKKICEAGGSSFIKDNRSYILVNHFSDFKTTLDQSNYDGTERQEMHLVEINPSIRHIHGRNEILVEFRKVQNRGSTNSSNSVKYGYCTKNTIIRIEIGDRQVVFNHCAEILLDNDFSAVSRSIPYPEIPNRPTPMRCDVYLDNYRFKMELRDATKELQSNQFSSIKKPQTNVNTENLKQVCDKIKQDMKPNFEKWLYKDFAEGKKNNNIELAVKTFLAMNGNDLRKLEPNLRECGMNEAANKVNEITDNTRYDPSRRSLPPTEEGTSIGSLRSCEPGNIVFRRGRGNDDSGPQAIAYEVNDRRKGMIYEEEKLEGETPESEKMQEACNTSSENVKSNMNPLSAVANSPRHRASLSDTETSQTNIPDRPNDSAEKPYDDNSENQVFKDPQITRLLGNSALNLEERKDESDYENLKLNEVRKEPHISTEPLYVGLSRNVET